MIMSSLTTILLCGWVLFVGTEAASATVTQSLDDQSTSATVTRSLDVTTWTVVTGVCPANLNGWTEFKGKFDTMESCESMADEHNASMFTFNFHSDPEQCWGNPAEHATWDVQTDPHCDSGCVVTKVTRCGSGPSPPQPLPPGAPRWVGPVPSISINSSAGLPLVSNAQHINVYKSIVDNDPSKKNPFGVYNHGPMITKYMGKYFVSWYNAPVGEDVNKRSVFATSDDGVTWSAPTVLFPTLTNSDHGYSINGEENGPWTILGATNTTPGRLYTQSGSIDAGEHHEGIISVMRQVVVDDRGEVSLGAPFWLNETVPAYCTNFSDPECSWPTYEKMDNITHHDASQLLASFVRTTVVYPDMHATATPGTMEYNERSLYKIPGTRDLVLLLRGKSHALSVAMCTLPDVAVEADHTLFSCRPGVGDAFMNLVEVVSDFFPTSQPRICNWTTPQISTLPDSGSRTCAAQFPTAAGIPGIYLVGNQIDKGRDPVTLSLSADGRVFDRHWAVRASKPGETIDGGGSCPRFVGHAKGCGYQYPGAMIDVANNEMIVSYSIGKEDIAFTKFKLTEIAPRT
eukprot:m.40167 g.40167  ORF g.40167 m.40167 type:complete len:572 (-) comp18405_c0_seq1:41-1756(-)